MATSDRGDIAARVRAEIVKQGMKHREVAEVLGVDQGSVTLRIGGKRPFRAEELAKLAAALGVPVSQFYGETPASTGSAA